MSRSSREAVRLVASDVSAPTAERRRCDRVPVQLAATYRSSNLIVDACVENLSQTGLHLFCTPIDASGTEADIILPLPGQHSLVVTGEVVWSDTLRGMGLQFRDLPRELRRSLANFILQWIYRV